MALFKSDEEVYEEARNKILSKKEFDGRVGQIHQGLSEFGLWGVMDNGKVKFKPSKFKIYDDKIMIERNRNFINFYDIKEIFQETDLEALLILNNGDVIPIKGKTGANNMRIAFKAFLDILKDLIKENKQNPIKSNTENVVSEKSEDNVDKLIQLGKMYEKGLLSDEEFALMKNNLIYGNNGESTDSNEENTETSNNLCKNCGEEFSEDASFCSECGTKLE